MLTARAHITGLLTKNSSPKSPKSPQVSFLYLISLVDIPADTKHLYNNWTMLDQRRRRYAGISSRKILFFIPRRHRWEH